MFSLKFKGIPTRPSQILKNPSFKQQVRFPPLNYNCKNRCHFHLKIGTVFDEFLSNKGRTTSFIYVFMMKFNLLPNFTKIRQELNPSGTFEQLFLILLWTQHVAQLNPSGTFEQLFLILLWTQHVALEFGSMKSSPIYSCNLCNFTH